MPMRKARVSLTISFNRAAGVMLKQKGFNVEMQRDATKGANVSLKERTMIAGFPEIQLAGGGKGSRKSRKKSRKSKKKSHKSHKRHC